MTIFLIDKLSGSLRLAVLLSVIVAVPCLLLAGEGSALNQTVLTALATMILVVSLYTFSGNSGVFSFGHLAMAMVGGYVAAIASMPADTKELLYPGMLAGLRSVYLGPVGAVVAGGLAAMMVGGLLALLLARLSGLTAGLATFVVLLIAFSVATGLEPVTNGSSGIVNIPMSDRVWQVLPWTALAIGLSALFQSTKSCQLLRASREDLEAAASVGVNVQLQRAVAFVFSSFIAGIGGAVYIQVIGSVSPSLFYLGLTTTVVAMLVIGGMKSLSGAVLGTLVIAGLNEGVRRFEGGVSVAEKTFSLPTGTQQVALALALLLILIARPDGLTGGGELAVRRYRARKPRRFAAAESMTGVEA
jgi:branched-chain amino acid transport system permease protein